MSELQRSLRILSCRITIRIVTAQIKGAVLHGVSYGEFRPSFQCHYPKVKQRYRPWCSLKRSKSGVDL
jgi:hypothetical protein